MKSVGSLLDEFLAQRGKQATQFSWMDNHCCHFCLDWVQFRGIFPMRGPIPGFIDRAASRTFFRTFFREIGTFEGLVDAYTNLRRIEVPFIQQGDLALIKIPDHDLQVLGIYCGPYTVVMGEDGKPKMLEVTPSFAWRVS